MAFGGSKEDDEWKKFQQNPESLKQYLSARKPSDPSWNKYVIYLTFYGFYRFLIYINCTASYPAMPLDSYVPIQFSSHAL